MPGFNRTGPAGAGPMTGGGRGFCGSGATAYNPRQFWGVGRGSRRGCGRGFGWGYGFRTLQGSAYPPVSGYAPQADFGAEMQNLKSRADILKTELDRIENRISELDKLTKTETE